MSKNNSESLKYKLKLQVNNLITIYEQKAQCGIFFKLSQKKSPLEIIGVLDFLKYKIKKWNNTNIFSYKGNLFRENPVLVIGSRDFEEAISIMIYMFLSNIIDNEYEFGNFMEIIGSSVDIEYNLRQDFSKNIEKGYPDDSDLELELKNHLNSFFKNNNSPKEVN
ncbi:MAG: hypothetical protein ACFE91_09340 [Promethearchaeota archaeon]